MSRKPEEIKSYVRRRYGSLAQQQGRSCCSHQSGEKAGKFARGLYSEEELQSLPSTVRDISLGCGNPSAVAELKPGDVVLDLGSGGGIDCLFSAKEVGEAGKVIGLDMTPSMVDLAKLNAQKMGVPNVEFRLGEMEEMPVDTESVDVVISNCVINLSPDKDAVFSEAFRVLKPGGRLCISDIVGTGELPPEVQDSMEAWAGCVAGALDREVYLNKIRSAGFVDLEERISGSFGSSVDTDSCCSANQSEIPGSVENCLASVTVKARKPFR